MCFSQWLQYLCNMQLVYHTGKEKVLHYSYSRISDVAWPFPGCRAAHPEDQNEEDNWGKLQETEEQMSIKCSYLAHPEVRGWLRL